MSWYKTGDPRQDWASNWRHFWTLTGEKTHYDGQFPNGTALRGKQPVTSGTHLLSFSSESPREFWMEMLGEVKGYCKKKAWLSADVYWHLNMSAGGHTCWSRAKVSVSRTNWETESSAVDGCRTRLTSQPLEDTDPAAVFMKQTKSQQWNMSKQQQNPKFENCERSKRGSVRFKTTNENLEPQLIKQRNVG